MKITFDSFERFEGQSLFPPFIEAFILDHGLKRVAEIGAGANPAIPQSFCDAHGIDYFALDADAGELQKGGSAKTVVFDMCKSRSAVPHGPFDLIFSRMTAEHYYDADLAYENMFHSVVPGGFVAQSFACLFTGPFVVNWLLPEVGSDLLLRILAPRDRYHEDKFRAYYRRCRGPIPSQLRFFDRIGFQVYEYRAYFGHPYYKLRLGVLHRLEKIKTEFLVRNPLPYLVSYSTVVLRRPE